MKKVIPTALAMLFLLGVAPVAHAVDMVLTSTDPIVDKAKFSEVVNRFLPDKVKALGPEYRLYGTLETASYRDGESFYFYSIMLHRKVVETGTGKIYWAITGGIRAHGITAGGEELVKHVREDMVLGTNSFKTDQ
ncbi:MULTISPECIES: hypothetical protein [Caballeronia]|uniref:hypothetical protein n=1 Tax=Caballeronia TaxID=1827195 RepID=UPI001FD28F31|nr:MULTISPECIES: hypothetical protein [Caballeronia]MDR5798928.1 hypothetical protein [Caballeronia sp. LZ001]